MAVLINIIPQTILKDGACQRDPIGRASLARENEAGGIWGQKVHILHVNVYNFVLF